MDLLRYCLLLGILPWVACRAADAPDPPSLIEPGAGADPGTDARGVPTAAGGAGSTGASTRAAMDPDRARAPDDDVGTSADGSDAEAGADGCAGQGLELVGLTHSPGGELLPHACEPFDALTNNPYAIRCIDADPEYATDFPGDEYCILPPEPGLGIQIGVHPPSHEEGEALAAYVLEPGEETNQNYFQKAANEEERFFLRSYVRMRTGSHHLIVTAGSVEMPDGFEGCRTCAGNSVLAPGFLTTLPSAQRPDQNVPDTQEIPEENVGLAFKLLPNQQVQMNMHHFNASEGQILREVWINLWFMEASEVEQEILPLTLIGNPFDLVIQPGESRELVYGCAFQDARIISLTGHRHAWTSRFGIWSEVAGDNRVPLYESYDYNDMPTYWYDSVTQNPAIADGAIDGAHSGMVELKDGAIGFTCEITNGSDAALSFSNELFTGEMCIVFGTYVGTRPVCQPGVFTLEDSELLGPFRDVFL